MLFDLSLILMRIQMMYQRSILSPTIARGLSAIRERCRSIALKRNIDQLTHLSLEECLQLTKEASSHDRTSSMLKTIIELRLWKLAQVRLYNPHSGRRLKPAQFPRERVPQARAGEAMLDETDEIDARSVVTLLTDDHDHGTATATGHLNADDLRLHMEDEFWKSELGDNDHGDLLDIVELFDLGDDMLDSLFVVPDVMCEEDMMFSEEDDILDEDYDLDDNMLKEDVAERHTEDMHVDLFQDL